MLRSRFPGYPLGEILQRWDVAARAFAVLPDDPVMGTPARWAFGDAVIHTGAGALVGLGR
jgi:hypothetical protein